MLESVSALFLQATKTQLEHEQAISNMETSTSQARELREAAASAAVLGDGVGASGRYRDAEFFLSESQPGGSKRKFEEEGFSVRGGTASQMDGAVLDLMADDQVHIQPPSLSNPCPQR